MRVADRRRDGGRLPRIVQADDEHGQAVARAFAAHALRLADEERQAALRAQVEAELGFAAHDVGAR
jgi:hypothetical protein